MARGLEYALAWIGGAFVVCSLIAAIAGAWARRAGAHRHTLILTYQGYAAAVVWALIALLGGSWLAGVGEPRMPRAFDPVAIGSVLALVLLLVGAAAAVSWSRRRDMRRAPEEAKRLSAMLTEVRKQGAGAQPAWRATSWQPTPDEPYIAEGVAVAIEGGPLDGRTAHVADARESLWLVQRADGGFESASAMTEPDVPAGARVLGRYTVAPGSGALRWYPTES